VGRTTYTLAKNGNHRAYTWANTNLLRGSYSGVVGIKTGHTDAAGYRLRPGGTAAHSSAWC
jgi:D-alanyl-D-alanine carboxypeptidase (penicillin-binding protein 5/6)